MKNYSFALITVFFIFTLTIFAVEAKLSASGVQFVAEAEPRENLSHDLIIALGSDEASPLNLTAEVLDWNQSLSGYNHGVEYNPDIAPYSARSFLAVLPSNFSLEPGTYQKIKIEGQMPTGDGGRYAIVQVKSAPRGEKGQGVSISLGINTIVLLTIAGSKLIKTGEIENLSLEIPISGRQQNVSLTFKNTGNYHYKINVSAQLKDKNGKILAEANPTIIGSIIPTAKRQIKFSLVPDSELKSGIYTLGINVTLPDGTPLATKEIETTMIK
jgi:P pilus assembly chaperone PapD